MKRLSLSLSLSLLLLISADDANAIPCGANYGGRELIIDVAWDYKGDLDIYVVRAKTGQTVISIEDIAVATYQTHHSVTGLCKRLISLNETLDPQQEGQKSDPKDPLDTEYQYLNGRQYYVNIRTAGVDNFFSLFWCSTSGFTPSPDYPCASNLTETGTDDEVDIRFYIQSVGGINVVPLMFEPAGSPVTYSFPHLSTTHELPVDLDDLCAIHQQCASDEYGLYFAFGQKAFYEDESFSSTASLGSAWLGGTSQVGAGVSLSVPSTKTVVIDGPVDGAGDSQFEVSGRLVVLPASSIDGTKIVVQPGGSVVMESGEHAIDAGAAAYQYHDLILVKPGAVVRVKESSVVSFGAWARIRVQGTNGLDLAPGTIFEFGDRAVLVIEGDFDATNVTFTSVHSNPTASTGWGGITFQSGSDGYFDGVSISGVGGYGGHSVRIVDSSPTFVETTIDDAAGYGINGLYVTGSSAHPTFKTGTITGQTGSGIILQSLAFISLQGSTITSNSGWGMIAGFGTDGFLSPLFGASVGTEGNTFSLNGGGGIDAYLGADLEMAYYYYPIGGFHADGYNLFVNNALDGLQSRSSAILRSGTLSTYRMNSLFGNNAFQAEATGSGSSVQARCNWWTEEESVRLDINESSGGMVSNDYFLLANPIGQQSPPTCSDGSPPLPRIGATNVSGDDASPTQTTRSARGELVDAIELTIADALLGVEALGVIVSQNRDASTSAAALIELSALASRQDLSLVTRESAFAALVQWSESTDEALRAAALRGLILAHARSGNYEEAITQANDLFVGTTAPEEMAFAGLAKVFLYGELGDAEQAGSALNEAALLPGVRKTEDWDLAQQDLVARFGDERARLQPRTGPANATAGDNELQAVGGVVQINSVFPNPISRSGTVVYTTESDARVTASLYDVLGREILGLYDGETKPGLHKLTIPDMGFAAGVYFLRLIVEVPDLGQSTMTFPVSIVR